MTNDKRSTGHPLFLLILALVTGLMVAFGSLAVAQDEDVTDNEVCMECHTDMERSGEAEGDKPRVHNDDGSMIVEDHDMWSCIDCHTNVTELPHPDDHEKMEVDCLDCHEEVPEG